MCKSNALQWTPRGSGLTRSGADYSFSGATKRYGFSGPMLIL